MPEYQSISKQKPEFPDYLDFQTLRNMGIKHLQFLSGKIWTDYNLHDPGVTILEELCYAITDLGYRNNLDIKDLLALNPEDSHSRENNFFTPDEVLTCNPVTELDLRKRLIDIPGVRNAWLERIEANYQPVIYVDCQNSRLQYQHPEKQDKVLTLTPRGLYTVYLDLEPFRFQNALLEKGDSLKPILEEVKAVLCSYRNLGEDFQNIIVLEEEEIALCSDIELEGDADPEEVLVEIYVRVQEFLAPRLQFYTLQELLVRGKNPAEIFAGRPSSLHDAGIDYESHGFIDTAELEKLTPPTVIHTSDLYRVIGKVPGVAAIRKLSIANYIKGDRKSKGEPWRLYLTENHRPVLAIDYSRVTFFKGDLPFRADADEVKRLYYEQQAAYIKAPLESHELDLSVPRGNYYNLADHYSIHHDFPLTYGIGEDGLPKTASAMRQAQARQLKGYLLFFDQLLANYLAQLAQVRALFSWELDEEDGGMAPNQQQQNSHDTRPKHLQRTYFNQTLDFPSVEDIVHTNNHNGAQTLNRDDFKEEYQEILDEISEDDNLYLERRNRFLDHLLARFAESFTDYVLLNYRMNEGRRKDREVIKDKARFLQEYPSLSRDRFRASNYCNCQAVWDTDNVAGFKKRVCRLLGIEGVRRRSLSHYRVDSGYVFVVDCDPEGSPWQGKQIYDTEEEARAALEEFLSLVLDRERYKRLSYSYFYHYGWEVVDRTGEALVSYQQYFPTRAERQAALAPLLQELFERLAGLRQAIVSREESAIAEVSPVSPEDFITIESDGEDRFKFRLDIPPSPQETGEVITFKGLKIYDTWEKANEAANLSLQQIRNKKYYLPSRLGSEKFTYYGYAVVDQAGKVWADTPDYWLTPEEREKALQRQFSYLQANQNASELAVGTPTYHFDQVESGFKYRLVDALKEAGTPANLLVSEQTFEDLESARNAFRDILLLYATNEVRYNLIDNLSPPHIYSFELQDEAGNVIAQHLGPDGNPIAYATESERDDTIAKIVRYASQAEIPEQFEEQVFFGYYFYLTLLEGGAEETPLQFRSLNWDHTKISAWEAAGAFAENLRYLRRYVSLTDDETGESYGLGITDESGEVLAITHRDVEPLAMFQQLNLVESLLQINQEGATEEYRFNLVDRSGTVLLEGIRLLSEESLVREHFYRDVLGILFEPEAIARTETNGRFGFEVVTLQPEAREEIEILATHPRYYDSAGERNAAIDRLLLLLRTVRLREEEEPLKPAYSGQIYEGAETEILLQGTQRYSYVDEPGEAEAKRAAWQHGNKLIELAQEEENFRLIDDEDENNPSLYGWEVTNEAKDITLGTRYYATPEERKKSIEDLQACLNQESFHLLEHILLRPRSAMMPPAGDEESSGEAMEESALTEAQPEEMAPSPDEPQLLPISLKPSDCLGEKVPCLASYDPYSFWITIVLPYWPVRFGDRHFRRLVERTLRMEAPAHIALRICWLDVYQMYEFESAYQAWLKELCQNGGPGGTAPDVVSKMTEVLKDLLAILSELKNVYPEGTLHDCEESGPEDNPIILNQTALGTAHD